MCVVSVFPFNPDPPPKNRRGELSDPTGLSACLHLGHFCLSSTLHPHLVTYSKFLPPSFREPSLSHSRDPSSSFLPTPHQSTLSHHKYPPTFFDVPTAVPSDGQSIARAARPSDGLRQTPFPNHHTRPCERSTILINYRAVSGEGGRLVTVV